MSLWDIVFAYLAPQPTVRRRSPAPARRGHRSAPVVSTGYEPGELLSGVVDYVEAGKKFVKVRSEELTAVVFLAEISEEFVDDPAEVLREGQAVEFVLVKADPRGWVASIAAAAEARARLRLAQLEEGSRVTGTVAQLTERGIQVDDDGCPLWVPLAELAWRWLDHPAEAVRLGERVTVEVLRIETPEGWLENKRARRARAIASLRACSPEPQGPSVRVAFSGFPFKLWAMPRKPRRCDVIACFVLEALAAGRGPEEIATLTGLPVTALGAIRELLEEEGLVDGWTPTTAGIRLSEAIARAEAINADPIRGMFVSAAPPDQQLLPVGIEQETDYPRDWPKPVSDVGIEQRLVRATDEALPEWLLANVIDNEKERQQLAALQADDRIRVFLRRDGSLPWRPVQLDVSEHWLLAGLWKAFEPVGEPPFRPHPARRGCGQFLLLRLGPVKQAPGKAAEAIYVEPYTRTAWRLRAGVQPRIVKSPQRPPPLSTITDQAATVLAGLESQAWCYVNLKSL